MPAKRFFCCNCNHGPWVTTLDIHCHECHHLRCSNCRVIDLKATTAEETSLPNTSSTVTPTTYQEILEEFRTAPEPNANLLATTTGQGTIHPVEIDPSPSDSGYATLSYSNLDRLVNAGHDINDNDNDNDNDNETVYSEVAGSSGMRTESYVEALADDLFVKVRGEQISPQMLGKLSEALPTLLKTVALNIGYKNRTQIQRDVMIFIHKQREAITTAFRAHYEDVKDLDSKETTSLGSNLSEIVNWLYSIDESSFEAYDEAEDPVRWDHPEEHEPETPGLEEYRKILAEDSTYDWMLAHLHRYLILPPVSCDIMNPIRHKIQLAFPQTKYVSRNISPQEVQVTFTVKWDIMGFLRQQDYGIAHSEAIPNSITLSGTETHALALPCQQYMVRLWPLTGLQTLKLIQKTLDSMEHKKKLSFSTPSRLTLEASIFDGTSIVVTASGLPYFVAEVGEQLAWLGSALRPSVPKTGISVCTPYLVPGSPISHNPPDKVNFVIEYKINQCCLSEEKSNGQCWSYLFSDPIIAGGFPVFHRPESDTGLEMPLGLMVAMMGTKYLDTFNSKVYIKGFNTMLVPAKLSDGLIIWHLLSNEDPSRRISYLSSEISYPGIAQIDLKQSRHILGWCVEAISIVGTTRATYSIGRSGLPEAHSRHMLEKVEVSGGQFVNGTAAFTLGNREKPVYIHKDGFLRKLLWISSRYMVLWDEGDKTGWLVNGASALLHVLRSSLEHSQRRCQSAWHLDPSVLKDPVDLSQPDGALRVLMDENNRNLTLYLDKTEVYEETVREGTETTSISRRQTRHYRLEDNIEHIYNILEKLVDHQGEAERRNGVQINFRPHQQLEGWDFKDLVVDGDPISPRVTILPTTSKGWVDFTQEIHAVTLFGTGFGELIQPRRANEGPCNRWSPLPKGNYYLAVCVASLLDIMKEYGDAGSNPRRLCDEVVWHMKDTTFDACPCTKDTKIDHHDPVQILFLSRRLKKKPQGDLKIGGAVIFGYDMKLSRLWKGISGFVKGDASQDGCAGTPDSPKDDCTGSNGSDLSSSICLSTNSNGPQSQSQRENSRSQIQITGPLSLPDRSMSSLKHLREGFFSPSSKGKRS
ncbi:hypothetical protein F4802DRAFT_575304 [Xylaria palmicola]|nr:hypothetical protein F4802DRAFT_575304 [Xylaria palmicola]